MRNNGVSEEYITGNASKFDKYMAWAETVEKMIGNPLYHWTHLELKKYFDFNGVFNKQSARSLYDSINEKLKTLTARKIIKMSNVDTICTTDDPIDNLEYHRLLQNDKTFNTKVYPAFRPDKIVNIDWSTFIPYVKELEKVVGYNIKSLKVLIDALDERCKYFNERGCRVSDHALDVVMYEDTSFEEVDKIFKKALNGDSLDIHEVSKYRGFIIVELGKLYKKYNWCQQYHIKALRNNNSRMMSLIGPDTGFDAINDTDIANALSKILDKLDSTDSLPKTILYSLNPNDLEVLATLGFTHTEQGVKGKVQLGSAWWFNDQKSGMERQLDALANLGSLPNFIGMLTDSRSFLSYTRHEYFRRILCNFLGNLIENGEFPNDLDLVGKIVEDICFNNAKRYFDN
mgnify:CR=1 FL=1